MANHFLATIALVALASSFAYASDPSPLQDFCVAINDPKAAGIYLFSLFSYSTLHVMWIH